MTAVLHSFPPLFFLLLPLSYSLAFSFASFHFSSFSFNSLRHNFLPLCAFALVSTPLFISTSSPIHPVYVSPSLPFLSLSLSSGLTKDGGGSANAESLEEVLNILAEEGSDWIYGFFTFLYDVVSSPVERGEEEEEEGKEEKEEAAAEMKEEGGAAYSDDVEVKGVILDLQNQ